MANCAFVGDALSALGFRLAGVDCHTPEPGEVAALVRELAERVELILLTAERAREVPAGLLAELEMAEWPLVLVIPDVRRRHLPADRAAVLRRQLGMAE
jgi:vacuolar-type H+-ATPase subunit F/Vma7